jgi:hypothetical protein
MEASSVLWLINSTPARRFQAGTTSRNIFMTLTGNYIDLCQTDECRQAGTKFVLKIYKTGIGYRPYLLQLFRTGDCHGIVSHKTWHFARCFRRAIDGWRLVSG